MINERRECGKRGKKTQTEWMKEREDERTQEKKEDRRGEQGRKRREEEDVSEK